MSDNPLRVPNLFTLGPASPDPWVCLAGGWPVVPPFPNDDLAHELADRLQTGLSSTA